MQLVNQKIKLYNINIFQLYNINIFQLYTKAIETDKSKDDFYCNRAQAYIKVEKFKGKSYKCILCWCIYMIGQ